MWWRRYAQCAQKAGGGLGQWTETYVKKYELIETYMKKVISNVEKHNHKATY